MDNIVEGSEKMCIRDSDNYIFDLYGTLVDIHTDESDTAIWEKLAMFYGCLLYTSFCTLQSDEETILLSKWPEYKEEWNFPAEEAAIEHCKDCLLYTSRCV